ncbi:MAG: ComF family protein [Elusimicrobia bacterium]|nr:ComF family protein [Elusimicrobiota bacterium]
MGWRERCLHWLWPSICAHCKDDLPVSWSRALCGSCESRLLPHEPPYCLRCCQPISPRDNLCSRCLAGPAHCAVIRACLAYRGPAVSLVHAFKYRGRRAAAREAGRLMARAWSRLPELGRPDALIPVPLHPSRLRQRGYNQALELALALGRELRIPVQDLIIRTKNTRPQWNLLRKERKENLKDAFAGPFKPVYGLKLVLIDDVCTSGASLEACAKILRQAEAHSVFGYVFAREI